MKNGCISLHEDAVDPTDRNTKAFSRIVKSLNRRHRLKSYHLMMDTTYFYGPPTEFEKLSPSISGKL